MTANDLHSGDCAVIDRAYSRGYIVPTGIFRVLLSSRYAAARNRTTPMISAAASTSSMVPAFQRSDAQPSNCVMYQIGMFESEASMLYFVAAAPRPMASRTNPVKAPYASPRPELLRNGNNAVPRLCGWS